MCRHRAAAGERMTFAGWPTTTVNGGTSCVTTAPAPTDRASADGHAFEDDRAAANPRPILDLDRRGRVGDSRMRMLIAIHDDDVPRDAAVTADGHAVTTDDQRVAVDVGTAADGELCAPANFDARPVPQGTATRLEDTAAIYDFWERPAALTNHIAAVKPSLEPKSFDERQPSVSLRHAADAGDSRAGGLASF